MAAAYSFWILTQIRTIRRPVSHGEKSKYIPRQKPEVSPLPAFVYSLIQLYDFVIMPEDQLQQVLYQLHFLHI